MKAVITGLFLILLVGCSETEEPDTTPDHTLVGTSWEGPDEVAAILYGGNNVMVFEFLEEPNMQRLYIRNGTVRRVVEGTYVYNHPEVTVTLEDNVRVFEISGSVMEAPEVQTLGGGNLILQKK